MTKTQPRIRKHEMKEDSFVTFAFRAQEYIQSHQRLLLGALGALVVVAAGAWLYASNSSRSRLDAEQLLSQAFARVQQNDMQGAATLYRQVSDDFGGTPAAREAVFYLANLQFVQEQWADAITSYETYLKNYSAFDPGRNVAARAAMGDASQALGDHARALEYYNEALKSKGSEYLRAETYLAAARSALALDKRDEATAYADRLFELQGNSTATSQMRELLAMHGIRYTRGF